MNRAMIALGVAACLMSGCRSTCCDKPRCATYASPPPPVLGPVATTPPLEVWSPSQAAPAPPAPAPNFPAGPPRSSGYAPPVNNPSHIANVPAQIMLEKPEFSEMSRRETTSAKPVTNRLAFSEVKPGKLATGPKPTLDDLDRLARDGYRQIIAVGMTTTEADRRVFASRGLTLTSGETLPSESEPAYVYGADAPTLRNWWIRYFKETDVISNDAAIIRADRLLQ